MVNCSFLNLNFKNNSEFADMHTEYHELLITKNYGEMYNAYLFNNILLIVIFI